MKIGFLIDIDGVLKLGDRPIPGADEFIAFLEAENVPFVLVTNNSTKTPEDVANSLSKLGIEVTQSHVITSAVATGMYLSENFGGNHRAFVIGEKGLKTAVEGIGWTVLENHRGAEFVIVGLDRSCDYAKVTEAVRSIVVEGAKFIASNDDRTMPSEDGPMAGAGTIVASVRYATGVEPVVIGKPNRFIGEIALKRLKELAQADIDEVVVIGDRPETDIKLAKNMAEGMRSLIGVKSILVLSGVTPLEKAETLPPDLKPDFTVDSVADVKNIWGALR